MQGWSVEGINRFNKLYDLIEKERKDDVGMTFEESFLKSCIEEKDRSDKSNQKKKDITYVVSRHDLWTTDVIQDENFGIDCEDKLSVDHEKSSDCEEDNSSHEDNDNSSEESIAFDYVASEAI